MTFEGEIYKIISNDYEPGNGGIHLKSETYRTGSQIALTHEEVKRFQVGQRVRVTVEAVEADSPDKPSE